MPENRDHTQFYGAIFSGAIDPLTGLVADNFFIAQGSFNLFANQFSYIYSSWAGTGPFEGWKKPLAEFRKIYSKVGANYTNFLTGESEFGGVSLDHAQIIGGIIETGRALAGAPAEAQFVSLRISPETFELYIEFIHEGQKYIYAQTGATYNATIQANLQIVGAAAFLGHALAVEEDPGFWNGVTWVLPE